MPVPPFRGCLYYARDANPVDRRAAPHRGRRRTGLGAHASVNRVDARSGEDFSPRRRPTVAAPARRAPSGRPATSPPSSAPPGCGPAVTASYLQAFSVPTGTRLGAVNALALLRARRPDVRARHATSRRWPSRPMAPARARSSLPATASPRPTSATTTTPGSTYATGSSSCSTGEPRARRSGQPVPPPGGVSLRASGRTRSSTRASTARGDPARLASRASGRRCPPCAGCQPGPRHPGRRRHARHRRRPAGAVGPGRRPSAVAAAIDRALAPRSFALAGVRVCAASVTLVRERGHTANVIGILPGRDATAARRGHRDRRALRPPRARRRGLAGARIDRRRSIHGADDNASGTAVVLALARAFADAGGAPAHARLRRLRRRGDGPARLGALRGRMPRVSARPHGADAEPRHGGSPARRTSLRGRRGQRHRAARRVVNDAAQGARPVARAARRSLRAVGSHVVLHGGSARCCSSSPVAHDDYHRPERHVGQDQRGRAGAAWPRSPRAWSMPSPPPPTPPAYVKVDAPPATGGRARGGYGAYFGVVPEFGEAASAPPACGSAACGPAVRPRRPDSRTATSSSRFAGVNVRTLEDLTFALRGRRPGDRVEVVVRARRQRAAASSRRWRSDADASGPRARFLGLGPPACWPAARRGSRWQRVDRPASRQTVAVDPRERRLANLRQLTAGGQNAEAYFDSTGTRLIFQSTRPPYGCDQIFTMKADGADVRLVSTGRGRTTCGFFFPDGAPAHLRLDALRGRRLPAAARSGQGYVWPIYPSYEIVSRRRRRRQSPPPHQPRRLRRRGRRLARRQADRLHVAPRRRPGSLRDERRRQRRAPPDRPARLRRRRLLLVGRTLHRLPRRAIRRRRPSATNTGRYSGAGWYGRAGSRST